MTIRYVGKGGSDSNNGLTWATRKLTLNGAEDTPVTPGDIVYVGAGTYRETLTVDVSGTFGNPITYIGDYTGQFTDGVGGVVRLTGSDNDQTAARNNCITATAKSYRTFTGFLMDTTVSTTLSISNSSNWTVQNCYFGFPSGNAAAILMNGASQAINIIRNCYFLGHGNSNQLIQVTHSSTLSDVGHIIENCIFLAFASARIRIERVGGITVRNIVVLGSGQAVQVAIALTAGQTVTVNNCIFQGCSTALLATAIGEITEDYNAFFACGTNRTNTSTGANSITYPALFDTQWFFQLTVAGAGPYNPLQFVSPFDLSSQSQLINVTGTNPTTTDMRGTSIQNTQREWGALEYDSTLSIKARQAGLIGDGGMIIS